MKVLITKIFLLALLWAASTLLAACGTVGISVETPGSSVEVLEEGELGGIEDPNVFFDPETFQVELLESLNARDAEKLRTWMTEPFFTGTWRSDPSYTSPEEALQTLFSNHLGADNRLSLVEDADLELLMGGKSTLSIPSSEAAVTNAVLVDGWGIDGRDEAILLIARQPDNSLKLHGWMVVRGGFSGARLGGVQPFNNVVHGYSLYLPRGYEITTQSDNNMVFIGPGEGPERGIAFITMEPANGQTTDQVVEAVKTELGEGFNIHSTAIHIEDARALLVTGLPGQDSNRQIFMVRNDLLYHMTFMPDDPDAGEAFQQMENLFAMIVNTFHFIQ